MKPDAGVRGREVLVVLPRAALRIRTFTNDTYQTTVKKLKTGYAVDATWAVQLGFIYFYLFSTLEFFQLLL